MQGLVVLRVCGWCRFHPGVCPLLSRASPPSRRALAPQAFDALRRMEEAPPVTYIPVLRGDPASGGDTHLEGLVTIHDMIAAGLM